MAATCRVPPPRSCLRLAAAELEADAMNGLDRIVAIHRGELGADVADVAVDSAVGDLDIELIGGGHDLLAAEHRGGPRQEGAEDAELDGGEPQRYAGKSRDMLLRIDRELTLRQRRMLA